MFPKVKHLITNLFPKKIKPQRKKRFYSAVGFTRANCTPKVHVASRPDSSSSLTPSSTSFSHASANPNSSCSSLCPRRTPCLLRRAARSPSPLPLPRPSSPSPAPPPLSHLRVCPATPSPPPSRFSAMAAASASTSHVVATARCCLRRAPMSSSPRSSLPRPASSATSLRRSLLQPSPVPSVTTASSQASAAATFQTSLAELKSSHREIMVEMIMDVLRVLASPNLGIRRKTLDIALKLITSRNVDKVVLTLKKKAAKAQSAEHEKNGEYRQVLV